MLCRTGPLLWLSLKQNASCHPPRCRAVSLLSPLPPGPICPTAAATRWPAGGRRSSRSGPHLARWGGTLRDCWSQQWKGRAGGRMRISVCCWCANGPVCPQGSLQYQVDGDLPPTRCTLPRLGGRFDPAAVSQQLSGRSAASRPAAPINWLVQDGGRRGGGGRRGCTVCRPVVHPWGAQCSGRFGGTGKRQLQVAWFGSAGVVCCMLMCVSCVLCTAV